MNDRPKESTQPTKRGQEIPIPSRESVLRDLEKIAKKPGKPKLPLDVVEPDAIPEALRPPKPIKPNYEAT